MTFECEQPPTKKIKIDDSLFEHSFCLFADELDAITPTQIQSSRLIPLLETTSQNADVDQLISLFDTEFVRFVQKIALNLELPGGLCGNLKCYSIAVGKCHICKPSMAFTFGHIHMLLLLLLVENVPTYKDELIKHEQKLSDITTHISSGAYPSMTEAFIQFFRSTTKGNYPHQSLDASAAAEQIKKHHMSFIHAYWKIVTPTIFKKTKGDHLKRVFHQDFNHSLWYRTKYHLESPICASDILSCMSADLNKLQCIYNSVSRPLLAQTSRESCEIQKRAFRHPRMLLGFIANEPLGELDHDFLIACQATGEFLAYLFECGHLKCSKSETKHPSEQNYMANTYRLTNVILNETMWHYQLNHNLPLSLITSIKDKLHTGFGISKNIDLAKAYHTSLKKDLITLAKAQASAGLMNSLDNKKFLRFLAFWNKQFSQ